MRRWFGWAGAAVAVVVGARHATHQWGANRAEQTAMLPGDELVPDPAIVATRACTIAAPPEEVWAWLVQIGQDRGGMYSYDWLENLLGLHIHSSDTIREEWQHLTVGDRVVLVPEGWAGMKAGYTLPVAFVDPPHTLVLRQSPPEHPWNAVWSFHVQPRTDGTSRLLSRSRSARHPGPRGVADIALDTVMDPGTWVMTRKMLLGIKKRAEAGRPPSAAKTSRRDATRSRALRRRLDADVARLGHASGPVDHEPVSEADLQPLPEPAQRYLRWMGVVGRPRDHSFRARFRGQIRMRAGQPWMSFDAWQQNVADPVTRQIQMRIDVAGVVPMFGSDTYVDGSGRMLGKVLGLFTVADGAGYQFDLGELVTYVNDAAMLAPSMLLVPNTEWDLVDDHSFDITFTDGANVVIARLFVDDAGCLVDFRTEDRWYAGTTPPSRTPWSTPMDGWTTLASGRRVPTRGSALWHLPDNDFTYVRGSFDPATIEFNVVSALPSAGLRRQESRALPADH